MAPRSRPRGARPVLAATAVVLAAVLAACSSSPNTALLEKKLRAVNGLTAEQAHCIATTLHATMTAKELHTVATADGRGGITDAITVNKLDDAIRSCVHVQPTTTLPPVGPTSVPVQEP